MTIRSSRERVSQAIVQEAACRLHSATDHPEVMNARVERRHVFRAMEVKLAPMRSRSVERQPRPISVPCAPVESAPAIAWVSMSLAERIEMGRPE